MGAERISCPECGGVIPSFALHCRFCLTPIKREDQPSTVPQTPAPTHEKSGPRSVSRRMPFRPSHEANTAEKVVGMASIVMGMAAVFVCPFLGFALSIAFHSSYAALGALVPACLPLLMGFFGSKHVTGGMGMSLSAIGIFLCLVVFGFQADRENAVRMQLQQERFVEQKREEVRRIQEATKLRLEREEQQKEAQVTQRLDAEKEKNRQLQAEPEHSKAAVSPETPVSKEAKEGAGSKE